MPATLSYPGVYIEEIPSGIHTITGVATSITAFIGRALSGPTDDAITINSYSDFERIFGGLWAESSLGPAVRDFYINGGSKAIIVRLFNPTFADETARQGVLTTAKTEADTAAKAVAKAAADAAPANGATPQTVAQAAQDAANGLDKPSAAAKSAAKAVAKAAADAAAKAGAIPSSVATAANDAVNDAVTAGANSAAPPIFALLDVGGLKLQAAYAGQWGNSLRARIDKDVSDSVATDLNLNKTDLFNLTVRDTKTGATEQLRNLTWIKTSSRFVTDILKNQSRLVRVVSEPGAAPTPNGPPAAGKDIFEDDTASTKVNQTATDGSQLDVGAFNATGKEGKKEGLYALEKADLFNLLCIPPYLVGGDVDEQLMEDAITYCEKRRAFYLIDPPSAWKTKDDATKGIETDVGRPSKNAAIFFPRISRPNPLRSNQIEDYVPCGAVAGTFARTDTNRGVWKAPAGMEATLAGAPELSVLLTDNENGELNPKGVNCLRTRPAVGRVVWGSRTREGDDRLTSEWKYIPVRRTALFIEESLYRGTQWIVFEPNDEPLWAQIRLNVGAFMNSLFRQGAFQGTTPKDAYFVKCDKETTTQNDVDRGIVNIIVGFAPLKPAEFVVIKLQQKAGEIQT
jgi:phage tail sheath protein FI